MSVWYDPSVPTTTPASTAARISEGAAPLPARALRDEGADEDLDVQQVVPVRTGVDEHDDGATAAGGERGEAVDGSPPTRDGNGNASSRRTAAIPTSLQLLRSPHDLVREDER